MSAVLANAAGPLGAAEAALLASEHFGVVGEPRPLSGERDDNFLITNEDAAYVLKATNPAEDPAVTEFHSSALLHAARADPGLPVPRIMLTKAGEPQARFIAGDGALRSLRLVSFLPGLMASNVEVGPALRAALGAMLARFDLAFRDFAHPADRHELSWDLTHASGLRNLLADLDEAEDRIRVERALDDFADHVSPHLPGLRRQVIHNDLNRHNVLVATEEPARIVGLLDFGDMVRAPLVNDLAIAVAYHLGSADDVLAPVLEIVAAYAQALPLEEAECDLLFDLIATRMAMTVLITSWRARRRPENSAYILKNHPAAVAGLAAFDRISRSQARERFRRACGLSL